MKPDMQTIDEIIAIEWEMFHAVNGDADKAPCQEDKDTFAGMRRGQFESWSADAVDAYRKDVLEAKASGRNIVMEKYIFMMKSTMPKQYEQVAKLVQEPDPEKSAIVEQITSKLVEQTVDLFQKYPYVAGMGRPLRSTEDDWSNTSLETYQRGELCTYSMETLEALRRHLLALEEQGVSLAKQILENSVKYYGYKTLEEAEAATKEHMKDPQIEFSFGCGCCGDGSCDLG